VCGSFFPTIFVNPAGRGISVWGLIRARDARSTGDAGLTMFDQGQELVGPSKRRES
jgi:hypothetical protein